MIVVAVSGRQDRGKTHSIIEFHKLLLLELDRLNSRYTQQYHVASGGDIRSIVKIEHNTTICVCSGGDDEHTIRENFNLAIDIKCNILISAVRYKYNVIPHYFWQELDKDELFIEIPTVYAFLGIEKYKKITGDSFEKIYEINAKNILRVLENILALA